MPVSTVVFDGEASGAVAAAKETQAAIDSVHGKSVTIDVNVRNGGASAAILETIGEHGNTAADAHNRLSKAEDRASASARDSANAHARATDGMREHSAAAERHMRLVDEMRGDNDRANESVNESTSAHNRAAGALDRHTASAKNFDDMWNRTQGRSFPGFAPPSGPTVQGRAPSFRPEIPSTTPAVAASYDMPGRTARVEALQAATNRLSVAQTRAAATATEYHRAFQQAYETAPAGANAAAYAEKATQGLRNEMTASMGAYRTAQNDVRGLESSFDGVGRTSSNLVRGLTSLVSGSLPEITSMAGDAGGALRVLGMGALVGAAGAGILGAATAGLGAGAGFLAIKETPSLAYAGKQAIAEFGKAFDGFHQQARTQGLPAMQDLKTAIGGLGKTIASVGVDNLKTGIGSVTKMTQDAAHLVTDLAPAIQPAERAFTSLFGAATRGIGQLAPDITAFSNSITANAPGIQQSVEGIGRSMLGIGQGVVEGLAAAGPVLEWMGNEFTGTGPSISGGLNKIRDTVQSPDFLGFSADDLGNLPVVGGVFRSLRHVPGLGDQGDQAGSYFNVGGDTPDYMAQAEARGKQMGATYAHTSPKYGTVEGESAPLGVAVPGSDDPRALLHPAQGVPKPVSPAAQVSATPAGAESRPSVLEPQRQQPLSQLPRSVGESGPGLQGTAQQLATLNQEMAKTTNMSPLLSQGMSNVGQAAQQSMQQAGSAAQQASPQFQQGLQGMQQHAQQLPPQLGSTMSMLAPALQQPLQQVPQQAAQAMQPQPIAQAAGAAVTKAVKQVQPAAESGGQDLGASVPAGASQGVTKNVDKVITVIEHLIKKVIQVGAAGLDSHSPSRVFAALGASIPQGLAVGINSESSLATQATTGLIGQMTSGATAQLGGQQQALQNQLAQQRQQLQNQQQQAQQQAQQAQQQIYQQPPGFGGSPFTTQSAAAQQLAKKQEEELKRAIQTGDTSRLSPAMRQKFEQAKQQAGLFQYKDGQLFDKARHDQLAKLGYSDSTLERIQGREKRHNDIAADKKDERRKNHVDAMLRAGSETSVRRKLAHEFNLHGKAAGDGTADGLREAQGNVKGGVADMINGMIKESKKRLGISSPSKVYREMGGDSGAGLAGGLSAAIGGASSAIGGVASDRGLQVGYRWATGIADGVRSVFKQSDFQASMVPHIENDQAKTVLGQLGLLGTAGSGAQVWKNAAVSFNGTSSKKTPTPIVVNLYSSEGRLMDQKITDSENRVLSSLSEAIGLQVG